MPQLFSALRVLGRHTVMKGALDPAPERKKRTTWREFLAAHWDVLAAADFFTVEVWTPRGLTRFTVLVLIHLASRRVQIAGISAEPDGRGSPSSCGTPPMPRTDSCDTSWSSSMTATRSSGRPCASSSRTTTTNGITRGSTIA